MEDKVIPGGDGQDMNIRVYIPKDLPAEDLPAQLFPETATWGLMYHEIKWGLGILLSANWYNPFNEVLMGISEQ